MAAAAAATAAGAAAGQNAAKKVVVGFTAEQLTSLDQQLSPGSSALVALIEFVWLETIEKNISSDGGNFSHTTLASD